MESDDTPAVDVGACTLCGGTGKVKREAEGELASEEETCPLCHGTGSVDISSASPEVPPQPRG